MKIKQRIILSILLVNLFFAAFAFGQSRREINFPDIKGYKTLKCDLHMHTVFSDGSVWPPVRVDEAWREGLDVIAITDHIEYQPHKNDVPTNHGRSHDIAVSRARERNILLIKAAEFTRETPPGHFNAVFIDDANALAVEDLIEGIKIANKQNAFVFWNHPGWKPEHKGWFDTHTILYENKLMHGIEVVNGGSYYPEAHQWCLEKNLTMMGNSDIHQPATLLETSPDNHRSITLVFARER
ncbi:MAG: PHP domain-containing protein, partial [Planctomycetota bacterium]